MMPQILISATKTNQTPDAIYAHVLTATGYASFMAVIIITITIIVIIAVLSPRIGKQKSGQCH